MDRFVTSRLTRLIGEREGWKRRPFFAKDWPHIRFVHDFDLYKLLGTIRYPGARMRREKTTGKPCAGRIPE